MAIKPLDLIEDPYQNGKRRVTLLLGIDAYYLMNAEADRQTVARGRKVSWGEVASQSLAQTLASEKRGRPKKQAAPPEPKAPQRGRPRKFPVATETVESAESFA